MVRPVTITAELTQWQLDDERNTVTGTIQNSANQLLYPERQKFTLLNVQLIEFTAHILVRTQTGRYFKLHLKDMMSDVPK